MSNRCDLIANKKVMVGNNVSKSKRRTKRRFYPNLQEVSLQSEILGIKVPLKLAVSTLRTINNKYGNLDGFLLNYKFGRMTEEARVLRSKVKKVQAKKQA